MSDFEYLLRRQGKAEVIRLMKEMALSQGKTVLVVGRNKSHTERRRHGLTVITPVKTK